MKASQIFATVALGAAAVSSLPTESAALEVRANLPGLNAVQTKHANAIIAQAKKDGVGAHGCQAGIATALVEVQLTLSFHCADWA